jgi:four helix bundle protein
VWIRWWRCGPIDAFRTPLSAVRRNGCAPSAVSRRLLRDFDPRRRRSVDGWRTPLIQISVVRDFRQLRVWQHAHRLTLAVSQATAGFPKDETYGLRSQIRRAASSIGANPAEASGRHPDLDQARFCHIAMGSACELEYHLLRAHDHGLVDASTWDQLWPALEGVKRMLTMFIKKLTADSRRRSA